MTYTGSSRVTAGLLVHSFPMSILTPNIINTPKAPATRLLNVAA